MKILYICTLWDEKGTGGRESHARDLANRLKDENEIVVINTHRQLRTKIFKKDKIKFYKVFHWNILFYEDYYLLSERLHWFAKAVWHIIDTINILPALKVLRIVKKEKPEVVHIHDVKGFSTLICLFLKLSGIKIVLTLHSYEFLCISGVFVCPLTCWKICQKQPFLCKIYMRIRRLLISKAINFVIAPSKFILDMYKRHGFFKNSQVMLIPYFIETKPFDKSQRPYKITFDILFIGRLSRDKGVKVLIEAFKNIKEEFLRLHIVGIGPEEEMLKEKTKGDNRIIFYGRIDRQEIDKFYELANVVVVPSVWLENFPMVILESFSFGVPVIGSRIGGIPELVRDGETGYTFNPGDNGDLAKKITFFINNPNQIKILGNNARKFAESNLIFEKCNEQLMLLYEHAKNNG